MWALEEVKLMMLDRSVTFLPLQEASKSISETGFTMQRKRLAPYQNIWAVKEPARTVLPTRRRVVNNFYPKESAHSLRMQYWIPGKKMFFFFFGMVVT